MATRVYSFKSVGEERSSQRERAAQQVVRPPIGVKTPLELSDRDDSFLKMHSDIENVISDNLKNLILTNRGERLFDYNFGANLKELTFELGNEETDKEAIRRIQRACVRYMPYIALNTFEPIKLGTTDDDIARIGIRITYTVPSANTKGIRITYTVPSANTKERAVEVILYTVG